MSSVNKKYLGLAIAGAAFATVLVYWSIFWPPVPRGWVQGAIGKRDVYRQAQLTDKDVGVTGQAKVTVDDVRKLLASQEFKTLANNANFQTLVASNAISTNAAVNNSIVNLVANTAFQNLLNNANFLSFIQTHQAGKSILDGNLPQNLAGNADLNALITNTDFHLVLSALNSTNQLNLFANPRFVAFTKDAGFCALLSNPAFSALVGNAQFVMAAAQNQLGNLAGNTNMQQAMLSSFGNTGH